jgi:type IV pilus assembly protein PilW
LIGVLVIFQVFAVNEDVRRTTTAGSDEQTSGLLALLRLERELRLAGFGINDFDLMGCTMSMYDNLNAPPNVPNFALAPVQITSNAGATPDVIGIIYGDRTQTSASVQLGNDMNNPQDTVTLTYRFGFRTGDRFVIGQQPPPAPQPAVNCTMAEVNGLIGLIDLQHDGSSYLNMVSNLVAQPRFNSPAGFPAAYPYLAGKVMNLGQAPVREQLSVLVGNADPSRNNKLYIQNFWADPTNPTFTAQAVADQIVGLKAEYGMDDGNNNGTVQRAAYAADDNIVDNYTTVNPTTQQGWQRVRAVRLAVVSRSLVAAKPLQGTTCDATPDFTDDANYQVRWARGPDAPAGRKIDVRIGADWRCYKYKVYESVVPLRNVFWRQP